MGYLPIRQSLEEGMFDLVIGNVYSSLGRLRHQNLLKECFYGIVANDHPLADKAFDLEELSSYPALLTEGQGSDRWWEHPLVRDAGYKPTQVTSIPGFLGVSLLLAGSPLVCISARRLCEVFTKAYPLKAIALPFSKQVVAIKQYWHERSQGDPAHRWLRQAIYNVCQSIEKN
jgi:DNA-binding transcriptional LysR family regulator